MPSWHKDGLSLSHGPAAPRRSESPQNQWIKATSYNLLSASSTLSAAFLPAPSKHSDGAGFCATDADRSQALTRARFFDLLPRATQRGGTIGALPFPSRGTMSRLSSNKIRICDERQCPADKRRFWPPARGLSPTAVYRIDLRSFPISAGFLVTRMPHASITSNFS